MIGAVVILRETRAPLGYVVQESGCWTWLGAIKGNGYGSVYVRGHMQQAHRWVYEQSRGPIPDGLTLDHLCRNRACVRPDHLEPVSFAENLRRGSGYTGTNFRKTECKRGHPFTVENIRRNARGHRTCIECIRAYDRRRGPARKRRYREERRRHDMS